MGFSWNSDYGGGADRYSGGGGRQGVKLDDGKPDHRSVPDDTGLTGAQKGVETRHYRYGHEVRDPATREHIEKNTQK